MAAKRREMVDRGGLLVREGSINDLLYQSFQAYAAGDAVRGAALRKEAYSLPKKKTKPVSLEAKRRRSYFAKMKW